MKSIKFLSLFLLGLVLFPFSSKAQSADSLSVNSHDKAQALVAKLDRELSLTDDQQVKVLEVLLHRSEQWKKEVMNAPQVEKKTRIEHINSKALKDISSILSKEQIDKYHQLRRDLKQQKQSTGLGYIVSDEDSELDF